MGPAYGQKARRRELRQRIRNALGTSRDGAPSLLTVTYATLHLHELMTLTSGGRYGVAIIAPGGEAIPFQEALDKARNEWQEA